MQIYTIKKLINGTFVRFEYDKGDSRWVADLGGYGLSLYYVIQYRGTAAPRFKIELWENGENKVTAVGECHTLLEAIDLVSKFHVELLVKNEPEAKAKDE